MSKKNFSEYLTENYDMLSNIIDNIEDLLSDKNINYKTNTSNTEIVVKGSNKEEIYDIIRSLPISSVLLYMILDVHQVKDKVYIRKKIK